jgi:hypothetical protein
VVEDQNSNTGEVFLKLPSYLLVLLHVHFSPKALTLHIL